MLPLMAYCFSRLPLMPRCRQKRCCHAARFYAAEAGAMPPPLPLSVSPLPCRCRRHATPIATPPSSRANGAIIRMTFMPPDEPISFIASCRTPRRHALPHDSRCCARRHARQRRCFAFRCRLMRCRCLPFSFSICAELLRFASFAFALPRSFRLLSPRRHLSMLAGCRRAAPSAICRLS